MSESFIGILPTFIGIKASNMDNKEYFEYNYFDNFTYYEERGNMKYFTIKPDFLIC